MRTPTRLLSALALAAALAAGGCTSGDDAAGTRTTTAEADALVVLKPTATDLNALDLRDKLIALPGVEGVVYDQAVKRLRVDFTAAASAAEREQAAETARADAAVQQVTLVGDEETVGGQPAPTGQPAAS